MSYEHRAYDERHPDGTNDPVVVLVVKGTHDVSRLIALFAGSPALVEQLEVGKRIRQQVNSHNFGRAALELLAAHGGPDFTKEPAEEVALCGDRSVSGGCARPKGHTDGHSTCPILNDPGAVPISELLERQREGRA